MYFQNWRLWKSGSEHSPRSVVTEHVLTVNMWKRPKYLRNLHDSAFIMFFIFLREADFENVSPSFRWYIRCVCQHIDCRCQVSPSRLCEFVTASSNAIIWKSAPSEHALRVNIWKSPKYLPNLNENAFVMFFHHSQGTWFQKCSLSVRWCLSGVC